MTTAPNPQPSRRPRRFLITSAGAGAAMASLATAAVASAAPVSTPQATPHAAVAIGAATQRPTSTIRVSARSMRAGSQLTITGDAPTNARAGTSIELESFAFNAKRNVNGIPAIRARVSAQGTYRVTTVLRQGMKPTSYAIAVNFQGKRVSPTAWITITPGPDSTVEIAKPQVRPGGAVPVSGDAPTYAPTSATVTLSSPAFARPVTTEISAQGTYQVIVPIRRGITPGDYSVTGSYQGHHFSNTATITVR